MGKNANIWPKMTKNTNFWAKMTKNVDFLAKFVRFGAKNPNSYGRKQKFWYPFNGKTTYAPCSHCLLVAGRAWDQMGQKCQYLAKKVNFGPNLAVYVPKILIFMVVSKSFSTHIMKKPPKQLVHIVFWSGIRSNGPKMPIFGPKCQFWAKFGRFWAQNPIFGGRE